MQGKFRPKHVFLLLFLFLLVTVVIDFIRISGYEVFPMRPSGKIDLQQDVLYYELINGEEGIDWNRLDGTLKYISSEYDCADFRLVNLVRILYEYGDKIPAGYQSSIENVLLNFRYWWDEPGENSMCYWSENHQILFASAEYLIGQLFPEKVFWNLIAAQ